MRRGRRGGVRIVPSSVRAAPPKCLFPPLSRRISIYRTTGKSVSIVFDGRGELYIGFSVGGLSLPSCQRAKRAKGRRVEERTG